MTNKSINNKDVKELYSQGLTYSEIANVLECHVRRIGERIAKMKSSGEISDLENTQRDNVQLSKKLQKQQDLNRIKNKSFREQGRLDNAVLELGEELKNVILQHELPKKIFRTKKIKSSNKVGGVIHLSDAHFNELVNILGNRYDFTVASQRIRKYIQEAKEYFKLKGVKDVAVCITGDMINSDRRLDEVLSQATNRAKALFLAVSILEQAILDLQEDFNLQVISVIGNESRMTEDIGWSETMASDNYDYIIHHTLKLLFRKSDIKFSKCDRTAEVIEIVGQKILLVHGNQIKGSKMEKSIQSVIGKYASQDILIDFVLSGHLHSSRIADGFARSSSIVGSNSYSWDGLQLAGRASQNIHIFYDNGNRDSIKIDLQNVDDIVGYPIKKEIEAYNAKSAGKAKKKTTIIKLVV